MSNEHSRAQNSSDGGGISAVHGCSTWFIKWKVKRAVEVTSVVLMPSSVTTVTHNYVARIIHQATKMTLSELSSVLITWNAPCTLNI